MESIPWNGRASSHSSPTKRISSERFVRKGSTDPSSFCRAIPAPGFALMCLLALLTCVGCASLPEQTSAEWTPIVTDPDAQRERPWIAREFADRTPAYVPDGALRSVALLYDPTATTLGSGILVGPRTLLTAAHVVDDYPRTDAGQVAFQLDGKDVVATVLAAGNPEDPHGDWALLGLGQDSARPVASIHERALNPEWSPSVDDEILLVGFAAGFFDGGAIDLSRPSPSVPVRARAPLTDRDGAPVLSCWFATGEHLELGGMSGGAAMLWNSERGQAELIGIFTGYVVIRVRTHGVHTFLGFPMRTEVHEEPGIAYQIQRLPGEELLANTKRGARSRR